MYPDSEYKYKETLELEIKNKLNAVFGSDFEDYQFVDHSSLGKQAPVYCFQCYLINYQQYLQIHVVGTDFGIKWGEKDSDSHLRSPLDPYSPDRLQEVLEEVKGYLEQHLTYSDLIFLDPLTVRSVDVKIYEIQGIINEVFQEQVSFGQRQYDLDNDQLISASFLTELGRYQTSFTMSLKGSQFSLTLHGPMTRSLEENWYFLGWPQDLTAFHLKDFLQELKVYLEHSMKEESSLNQGTSNKQTSLNVAKIQAVQKEEATQEKTQEEKIAELSQQKADRERYLSLHKLFKLQLLIFILFLIAAGVAEFYMGVSGYESFKIRVSHAYLPVHSEAFFLIFVYLFLTLIYTGRKIQTILQEHPNWRGLPTKGVAFPTGGFLWTLVVTMFIVIVGTIDVTSRKPEPKSEPKLEDTIRLHKLISDDFNEKISSDYSRLLENLSVSASREEESQVGTDE